MKDMNYLAIELMELLLPFLQLNNTRKNIFIVLLTACWLLQRLHRPLGWQRANRFPRGTLYLVIGTHPDRPWYGNEVRGPRGSSIHHPTYFSPSSSLLIMPESVPWVSLTKTWSSPIEPDTVPAQGLWFLFTTNFQVESNWKRTVGAPTKH